MSRLYLQMETHLFKYRFGFKTIKSEWLFHRNVIIDQSQLYSCR